MKKTVFGLALLLLTAAFLPAQEYKKQFLKGNIADKSAAVRAASGDEGEWLTNAAIRFVLDNVQNLPDDRDLEGLAVAAILSITPEYAENLSTSQKDILTSSLILLFNSFSGSDTVQIALHSKIIALKASLNTRRFTESLNDYLQNADTRSANQNVLKSVITTLGTIGNNISFSIMYNHLNNPRYSAYQAQLEEAIIKLIPYSVEEVLQIVHMKDMGQMKKIFSLVQKNPQISRVFLSEIAENVISESILLAGNSPSSAHDLVPLQMDSIRILNENHWTRASKTVLSFFDTAKSEYASRVMSEDDYTEVIQALVSIAPIDACEPLIKTLGELNSQTERGNPVSEKVALAVINSIGSTGDKSAFDSLLSVTYLNYPDSVLSAARSALAGLRW